MGGAGRAGGGGLLQSLSGSGGGGGLVGFLNNTQQVIKTAQAIGPMVQQYGPLVRNLPALWKLYRGMKDSPNTTEEESSATAPKTTAHARTHDTKQKENTTAKTTRKVTKQPKTSNTRNQTGSATETLYRRGSSKPKLYI